MSLLKKENIKDRMLLTASRLWGIPDNEIEANFDPLVMLLIEACAAELEKISHAIHNSHDRLLEKMADLIVPEAIVAAKPASAMATATPLEPYETLTEDTQFFTQQSILDPTDNIRKTQQLFFTPIGKFPLIKARLAGLYAAQKLYLFSGNQFAAPIINTEAAPAPADEVWLMLSADAAVHKFNNLSLYFKLRNAEVAPLFYTALASAKAWINDQEVSLMNGYADAKQFDLSADVMLSGGHNYAAKVNRNTAGIYRQQIFTIQTDSQFNAAPMPADLQQQLSKTIMDKVGGAAQFYLKIKLPRSFPQAYLDGLTVHINAFPVINRKKQVQHYKTDQWINVVPLNIEQNFLDVQTVQSSSGGVYDFRSTAEKGNLSDGQAVLRSSGIGKTNSKEVKEVIATLTEAIRDESAYFSQTSNDFIHARLKEISMILARLDDQIQKSRDTKDTFYYILLKPKVVNDTASIHYWTTDGKLASNLSTGEPLQPYNHSQTGNKDAWFVSPVAGGRNKTGDAEKTSLLKQQLLAGNRIVSAYDVKVLCQRIFGSNLAEARVNKATVVGSDSKQGFSKVILVELLLNDKSSGEVDYLCKEVESILTEEATMVYPFKVVVL